MPPLAGFSNNPFLTRAQFQAAARSLIHALLPYQSSGGARIKLPLATGTHFDDVAAQLEGYARPLWAVGALQHSQTLTADEEEKTIGPFARGLANGTNPAHPEYWGPVIVRDQRMVEMEIISFALLAAPHTMFHAQTEQARRNITEWLKTINGKDFPTTNWLWFRVMTNLALIKVCGVPSEEVLGAMKADLDLMEQFYLGEGWAADGIWSDEGRQADYYSGSFAIQFSQLIYVKMAADLDPERCERFRSRAREFAMTFWRYFDADGAAIPFGRSLTYRFAFAGFWSAIAFAEVSLPAPLDDWGVIKGLLLRHFRWWSNKNDMFNCDGTLTIGFTYPNMYLSEDYNSPQSPYWAMKSFLALGLPPTHPFWTADEKPLPSSNNNNNTTTTTAVSVNPPKHILCNQPNHHFLLSMGQFCPWPLKATEAKYGKYAYSSHFGFSVPTGPLLPQLAPDSTLALSKDGGEIWRVPWRVSSSSSSPCTASLVHNARIVERVPALQGTWKPWSDADILVHTLLVAPSKKRWPDWHIRWHSIVNYGPQHVKLHAVQGGFAIQGRGKSKGEVLPCLAKSSDIKTTSSSLGDDKPCFPEGTLEDGSSALVMSSAGASGIRALHVHGGGGGSGSAQDIVHESAQVLKPDANTNLMWQRTLIPTLRVQADVTTTTTTSSSPVREKAVQFGCAVFALAATEDRVAKYAELSVEQLWEDMPVVGTVDGKESDNDGWFIDISDLLANK